VVRLLFGGSAARYTIFVRLGSGGMTASVGAMVVAGVALTVNLGVTLALASRGQLLVVTRTGLGWLVLAGIAAAGIDLLALLAYGAGFRVSSSLSK
jgi:uncharacterized membrane protein